MPTYRFSVVFVLAALALPSLGESPVPPPPRPLQDAAIKALIQSLGSEDFKERDKAAKSLVECGPTALKQLAVASTSSDLEVARRSRECIAKIDKNAKIATYFRQLKSEKDEERLEAIAGLQKVGPEIDEYLPYFLKMLDDPNVRIRDNGVWLLPCTSKGVELGFPKMMAILKDRTPGTEHVRWLVMTTFAGDGAAGDKGRQAVPILLDILKSDTWQMRAQAASTLAGVGKDDRKVGPALLEALSGNNHLRIRAEAASALSCLHVEAKKAVPVIIEILRNQKLESDQDKQERYGLLRTIGRFGPEAESAIPFLMELCTGDDDTQALGEAASALIKIGPAAYKAIPGLKELGDRPSPSKLANLIDDINKRK